jgi:hypothetical protein
MRLPDEVAKVWFKLPLPLRQRWWDETKFGKEQPSEELLKAVQEAVSATPPV